MKPYSLKKNDKVAIVSIASGILGEEFVAHELELAKKRFNDLGLVPVFMDNSLKGIEYLFNHPEKRAEDLKNAFLDKTIKAIFCAIGGDDSFRIMPYLLNDKEFIAAVKNNPKIFLGFSDITIDHFMLNKLGLNTFYGLSVLTDLAELDTKMLPYTEKSLELLFNNFKTYEYISAPVWYKDRQSYGVEQVGTPREEVKETRGFEVIKEGKATGSLYGGCLESIAAMLGIYEDAWFYDASVAPLQQAIVKQYCLFPSLAFWEGKILFLETSEMKSSPEMISKILYQLNKVGIFHVISGVVIGKPVDEAYYEEYKSIYIKFFSEYDIPVLYNLNFGHSYPKTIIPFGIKAAIDTKKRSFKLLEKIFEE